MSRTKKLTFFSAGYAQVSIVFPYAVVSPAYFAGSIQLGGLMQTASAFSSVQGALSFFVSSTVYRQLAEWRAVIDRLAGFQRAVEAGRAVAVAPPVVEVVTGAANAGVQIDDVAVNLPDGKPLVAGDGLAIPPGDRVLVTGPSGSGKSTLFRAIAGIWPFGKGRIVVPADARLMMLPQRPYFPVGTLTAAVTYPAEPGAFSASRSPRRCVRSACRRWPSGSTRRRTGTACCRSASSSGSASPAPCCRRPTICSSTKRPPRSTRRRKPRSTGCCRSGCPTPRWFRSAIARRSTRFTAAGCRSSAMADAHRVREAAIG